MSIKLAISNIAWTEDEDELVYDLIREYSYHGIEIAPSRIWPNPTEVSREFADKFRKEIEGMGISIVAMQSLLYGHPEISIFKSKKSNLESIVFLKKIIDLASYLGIKSVVFGSPKNRLIGNLNTTDVKEISTRTFKELGDYAYSSNVNFCIEPNPEQYGADFMTTTSEVVSFIKKINSPGLWLNIDAGTIALNAEPVVETIKMAIPYAKHLHISEPFLNEIKNIGLHSLIIETAIEEKYGEWISIEMKNGLNNSNIKTIKNVFDLLKPI